VPTLPGTAAADAPTEQVNVEQTGDVDASRMVNAQVWMVRMDAAVAHLTTQDAAPVISAVARLRKPWFEETYCELTEFRDMQSLVLAHFAQLPELAKCFCRALQSSDLGHLAQLT